MQIEESWNDLDLRTGGSDLTFGVLGPLEVRAADGLVHVGGPQIRALLALLLVRPGHVMSLSTLVASLWSSDAPPSAERTARTYMSRLRSALAPLAGRSPADPLIVTAPPGYLLRADPMSVDASLFEQLALAGRRALTRNDPQAARSYLRDALRLWRGDAYAEFADVPVLRAEASRLEEVRLSAVENRLQSELGMGLGPDLVAELDGLVTTHPLRERLWVQYMTSLYRSGRQAEALSAYQRARALLADELGLEPSVELAETHRRILAQDPRLLPEPAAVVLPVPAVVLATAIRPAGSVSEVALGWAARPEQELPPAEPELPADRSLAAQPIRHWVAPEDGRHHSTTQADWSQRVPDGMRPALDPVAEVLAEPRVQALVTRLGRVVLSLGRRVVTRLASVIPARIRAWCGWDTVEPRREYSQRPRA
ncbi:AfsR/SARP family transcriptional regulator [Jatrophihabitans sp.]|jgi:DNA-binding SARP family transcriptional activator|uniref:AfsR/SARP family transcriptional regulator n=1 Tax=Jatrophihabitans sp. TaxID=1932789 RepID=UPI002F11E77A